MPPRPPKPPKDPNKTFGAFVKRRKVPIIAGCAAAVLIAVGLIVFFQLTKYQKIDAQKLFAFKYSGLNGSGSAVGYLNYEMADPDPYNYEKDEDGNRIEKEYSDYFSTDKKALLKVFDKTSDYQTALDMRNALLSRTKGEYDLKVKLSKDSGLTNGDKISCTVEYDEETLKDALIKLENTEFEVEVSGLVEGETFDLWAGFEPKFTGMDEKGELDNDSLKGTYPFVRYYVSDGNSYNLKNGDTVTFQASLASYELENYNYLDNNDYSKGGYFKYEGKTYIAEKDSEEKQFTVSGLSEAEKVDIFEKIKFDTKGGTPYLRINRVNTDDLDENIKRNVSYYLDLGDKTEFKVGDTFKVKAYISSGLLSSGYKPTDTPDEDGYCYKEFTVDDSYGHYITEKCEASEMDAFTDTFAEFTEKFKKDYVGRENLGGVKMGGKIKSIDSFEAAKDYLYIYDGFNEGTLSSGKRSVLYRFYKVSVTVTDEDGKDSKKNIYAAYKFSGPYIDSAGVGQLESSFATVVVSEKAADLKKATVDKETGGKAYELGAAGASQDDSSKKEDESSKDESSSKGDEDSSGKDESSSKSDDDSSKKDDSSSKKDDSSSKKDD